MSTKIQLNGNEGEYKEDDDQGKNGPEAVKKKQEKKLKRNNKRPEYMETNIQDRRC